MPRCTGASWRAAVRPRAARCQRLHRGLVVSGDRFVATAGRLALQQALPDALAVEMEGAASPRSATTTACAAVRTIPTAPTTRRMGFPAHRPGREPPFGGDVATFLQG